MINLGRYISVCLFVAHSSVMADSIESLKVSGSNECRPYSALYDKQKNETLVDFGRIVFDSPSVKLSNSGNQSVATVNNISRELFSFYGDYTEANLVFKNKCSITLSKKPSYTTDTVKALQRENDADLKRLDEIKKSIHSIIEQLNEGVVILDQPNAVISTSSLEPVNLNENKVHRIELPKEYGNEAIIKLKSNKDQHYEFKIILSHEKNVTSISKGEKLSDVVRNELHKLGYSLEWKADEIIFSESVSYDSNMIVETKDITKYFLNDLGLKASFLDGNKVLITNE